MGRLFEIRVAGSARMIEAPSGDSILQCGLRAGLNLPYNCELGRCGECRARRIDGRLEPLFHTDYRFTQAEREQGWFLACAHTAASDLELELSGLASLDDLPLQTVQARIRRIEQPHPEVRVLHLRSPRSSMLRFVAGQQVELLAPAGSSRRLFLANCPCDAARPQLHLAVPPGASDFVDDLKAGDPVVLRGPYGRFVLPAEPLNPLWFLCWETGYAAVQSLLEQALALGIKHPVRILWFGRDRSARYLRNYCRALADSEDLLHYRGVDLPGPGTVLDWLAANPPGLGAGDDVFAVFPALTGDALAAVLVAAGASPQRLRLAFLD